MKRTRPLRSTPGIPVSAGTRAAEWTLRPVGIMEFEKLIWYRHVQPAKADFAYRSPRLQSPGEEADNGIIIQAPMIPTSQVSKDLFIVPVVTNMNYKNMFQEGS